MARQRAVAQSEALRYVLEGMALRWKILIVIGFTVAILDQWTKFLAVKHLTPGIAMAHQGSSKPLSVEEAKEITSQIDGMQQLSYFYKSVEKPCAGFGARCPTVRVIDGFWNYRYVENPGAAWGLMANVGETYRVPFFILISVAAIVFIIMFFRKLKDSQMLLIVSLSLVFGGAIGNFIDRLHLNYVIDFIDWYIGTSHWPTFNFADSAITTGVALLMIEWIRDWKRSRVAGKKVPAEST